MLKKEPVLLVGAGMVIGFLCFSALIMVATALNMVADPSWNPLRPRAVKLAPWPTASTKNTDSVVFTPVPAAGRSPTAVPTVWPTAAALSNADCSIRVEPPNFTEPYYENFFGPTARLACETTLGSAGASGIPAFLVTDAPAGPVICRGSDNAFRNNGIEEHVEVVATNRDEGLWACDSFDIR